MNRFIMSMPNEPTTGLTISNFGRSRIHQACASEITTAPVADALKRGQTMMAEMTLHNGNEPSYSLRDMVELGGILAKSGFFADSREAAQCVTKILAGRELGIGPVASMTGIYIVKGRVTLSANLMT